MIPQSFIQELLSRVDIVEIINKVSPIKKTGKNYMCCCPFHKERTPSFSVNPQRQFYKCFGCGAYGNVIGFVMQFEGLSYPEAIRKLAESIGMQVPEESPHEQQKRTHALTLTDMMGKAQAFYTECLRSNRRTIDYLKGRGISGETAARFGLGYSPDAWQSLRDVFGAQTYESADMEEENGCGLVVRHDDKRYDRFRGRLMFPIRNSGGQVIGFGARTLNGDEHPKYLNSPETALYHKGREIYGFYEAHSAIREKQRVIVCEGYMDVIQLAQAGFEESCAALGTSVTSDHVHKLLRTVDKIYFSFDGDVAGRKALRRAMDAALAVVGDEQEIRFVLLPPEHDPDSLIKEKGAHAYEDELKKSLTLTQFFVRTLSEGKDLATAEGRSRFLSEAKPLIISMMKAPILRSQLVSELAMHARMSPDELERMLGIAKPVPRIAPSKQRFEFDSRRGFRQNALKRSVVTAVPVDLRERLLQNLLNWPELAAEFSLRIEEEFVGKDDDDSRRITEVWRSILAGEEPLTQTQLVLAALEMSPDYPLYADLVSREMLLQTSQAAARVEAEITFDRLELARIEEKLRREAGEHDPDLQRIGFLDERRKKLKSKIKEVQRAFSLHQFVTPEA